MKGGGLKTERYWDIDGGRKERSWGGVVFRPELWFPWTRRICARGLSGQLGREGRMVSYTCITRDGGRTEEGERGTPGGGEGGLA